MPITYPVNDCYVCVQGEGVQTGVAMVLLRLHGCEVGCPFCDTKQTWLFDRASECPTLDDVLGENPRYTYADSDTIAEYIATRRQGPKWVLVSGGEPAQYPLKPLVDSLHGRGYRVALETSGTEIGHLGAGFDWVCVSPKIAMPGGKAIRPEAIESADEIKHVVGIPRDIAALEGLLSEHKLKPAAQICLQPVSLSPKATQLCIETVQQRGWRLSVQVHKYLKLP
ncbi:MAG TPA: 7-carboxy-7-deazaguanine synthase QueE [Aggregatilineales bacterium]|nr:7-carboxy-7-deazaguanine synthase QueE [Aggregatilineales bacterium]